MKLRAVIVQQAETLRRVTAESLAGIANLQGQVEALALFSGGVLQAPDWANAGPVDDMVAAVAETAHRFGLTQEAEPGVFVAPPIGYRTLLAIAHFNLAGKCRRAWAAHLR